MDVYDAIVKELFDNKSLSAFIYLIDHGRELEFTYNNKECFVSKDQTQKYVSIWIDKDEQSFESMEQLLEKACIDTFYLIVIWHQVEFGFLY